MAIDPDILTAYALGMLSPQEMQAVERSLRASPDDEAELRALQDALAEMVLQLPPETPAADSESALLARVRAEQPARPRRVVWLWPLVAAACVFLLIIGLGSSPWFQNQQIQRQVQAYAARPGAHSGELRNAIQVVGRLVRLSDGQVFVALNQPPQQAGKVYQAWAIAGGKPRSLGVFNGRTFLARAVPAGVVLGVTLEPPGGSPQPTSAPLALAKL